MEDYVVITRAILGWSGGTVNGEACRKITDKCLG